METLLKFPPGKRRQIVHSVHRDPEFAPQLYFLTTEPSGTNLLISLEQAIWDTKSNEITLNVVFEQIVTQPNKTHYAVDERGKSLHIAYDRGRQVCLGRLDLKYEKPDQLGYRRASVPIRRSLSRRVQFIIPDSLMLTLGVQAETFDTSVTAINVCPSTGELILHFKYVDKCGRQGLGPRLVYAIPPNMNVLSEVQSHEMETRSHIFSRSNDLLTLISYHCRHAPVNAADEEIRNRVRDVFPDGFMILYSHDPLGQMQPINIQKIYPEQLLQSFLPESLLKGLKTSSAARGRMPDFMFFGSHIQLLGHVNKYVLFFFHFNYVLAAKWPKNWYKLHQVPEVQQSKVLCVNKQKKHGQIRDVWLLASNLYFKVEKSGAETIRRMSLGREFKDYRRCAFCGKEEKGKRKNKQGKRVSNFKVCRMCKELDLHKSCTDAGRPGCYYCSFKCVRKHWKEHKLVHSGAGK